MNEAAARFVDPAYWHSLAPGLNIDNADLFTDGEPFSFAAADLAAFEADLLKEGYSRFDPPDWGIDIDLLAQAIGALVESGASPVLGFVYDELWVLFARLRAFLGHLIGPDYRQLPDFWIWHVAASDDDAGWVPHRDKGARALDPDGRPKSLTVWIPLTEARPDNGCVYLVPADRDPTYGDAATEDDWQFDLPAVRALPAAPGSVLCWNQAVVHWGARSSVRGPVPRISVAFEFQRGDIPPFNEPLLDPASPLNFNGRLLLIAKQILQYDHMYPLSDEMKSLAVAVLEAGTRGR